MGMFKSALMKTVAWAELIQRRKYRFAKLKTDEAGVSQRDDEKWQY